MRNKVCQRQGERQGSKDPEIRRAVTDTHHKGSFKSAIGESKVVKRQIALIVLLGSSFRKVEKKEGHDTRGCASSAGKVQRQTCWIGVDLCQRIVRLDLLVIKYLIYTFLLYNMLESVGPHSACCRDVMGA